MSEQDEKYLKSQKQYIEGQKICIENLELNIVNDSNMIRIHKKSLANNMDAVSHEKQQLADYLELYPYLKETEFDIERNYSDRDTNSYLKK